MYTFGVTVVVDPLPEFTFSDEWKAHAMGQGTTRREVNEGLRNKLLEHSLYLSLCYAAPIGHRYTV